jgi:hypothetical protein
MEHSMSKLRVASAFVLMAVAACRNQSPPTTEGTPGFTGEVTGALELTLSGRAHYTDFIPFPDTTYTLGLSVGGPNDADLPFTSLRVDGLGPWRPGRYALAAQAAGRTLDAEFQHRPEPLVDIRAAADSGTLTIEAASRTRLRGRLVWYGKAQRYEGNAAVGTPEPIVMRASFLAEYL